MNRIPLPRRGAVDLLTENKNPQWSFIAVLVAGGIYTLLFSYLSILRYNSFNANTFDLAIMIQTIWNTSHGRILEESINLGMPMARIWLAHKEFIFLPIALIYRVFSFPETIFIIQTLFLSLGAIPVYWLAKDKLKSPVIATGFAFSYLLYPAMQNTNLFDVHGVVFATSMLLFTFYFLQKENIVLCGLFAFISLLCREDAALILFMYGLFSIVFLRKKGFGIVMSVVGLFWFFMHYKGIALLRPMLDLPKIPVGHEAPSHWRHLDAVSDDPLYPLKFLAKKHNITYFINLFGPVGFLSLFSPFTLILAAPAFAINLLSDYYFTHGIKHHYTSTITPIIFIAAIYGSKNILAFLEQRIIKSKEVTQFRKRFFILLTIGVLVLSVVFFLSKSTVFDARHWKVTEHHRIINKVISMIPEQASVSAENSLAYHAAHRRELYLFPEHMEEADFVLYDFSVPEIRLMTRKSFRLPSVSPLNEHMQKLLMNRDYGIYYYEDGVTLFQKGYSYEEGVQKLAVAPESEIPDPCVIEITDEISFVGDTRHEDAKTWFYAPDSGVVTHKMKHVTLYWKTVSENLEDFNFVYQIDNGQESYRFNNPPVWGLYSTSQWRKDELIRDQLFWSVPKDAKPGKYTLSVALQKGDGEMRQMKTFVQLSTIDID